MTKLIADLSKRQAVKYLRILYPIWAVIGIFSLGYVPATLIVAGDVTTTASNILGHEILFRLGIVGSLVTQLIHIWVVVYLYKLFKSVNQTQASFLVIFGLVGIPITMLSQLNQLAVLEIVKGADYLSVFTTDQLHALMMLFLELQKLGTAIATVFWGLWLYPLGYLIKKSGYFPKILGTLVMLGAFGYVLDSFTHIILPNYATYEAILLPIIFLLTFGEIVFMIWVLFKGAKLSEMKSSN